MNGLIAADINYVEHVSWFYIDLIMSQHSNKIIFWGVN